MNKNIWFALALVGAFALSFQNAWAVTESDVQIMDQLFANAPHKTAPAALNVSGAEGTINIANVAKAPRIPEAKQPEKKPEMSHAKYLDKNHARSTAAQVAGVVGLAGGLLVGGTLGYIAVSGTPWVVAAVIGGAALGFFVGSIVLGFLAYAIASLCTGLPLFPIDL